MQAEINIQNNNKFFITKDEFLPADYTISARIPHNKDLAIFIAQTLQNILMSNNFTVSIGGDAIE